jgi:ATP-dependent RNA helicase RhlE
MTFKELGIIEPILRALQSEGYKHPTQIQEKAIPTLLRGKDLLACAQTGTGKTAAFAIPILQQLYINQSKHDGNRKIKALIVTPTRELAIQIAESFKIYGQHTGIKGTVIFGGVKQGKQVERLRRGVDILVATPGRLLDLMSQGFISLKDVEYSVLDEADHMLDMGFIHDIKKIVAKLPEKRQSLFFSATMPPEIIKLSQKILGNPEKVSVRPEQATADKVDQALYYVAKKDKSRLLLHVIENNDADSMLIFSRTKHGSDKIVKMLAKSNIKAAAIHGNKSQNARQRTLNDFKNGDLKILVATDIAARGIDVSELGVVINYDLPNVPETYVHRIGRTGRANASGIALSFCNVEERAFLKDIEKLIKQDIPVITEHPFVGDSMEKSPPKEDRPPRVKSPYASSRSRNFRGGNNRQSRNSSNQGKRS